MCVYIYIYIHISYGYCASFVRLKGRRHEHRVLKARAHVCSQMCSCSCVCRPCHETRLKEHTNDGHHDFQIRCATSCHVAQQARSVAVAASLKMDQKRAIKRRRDANPSHHTRRRRGRLEEAIGKVNMQASITSIHMQQLLGKGRGNLESPQRTRPQ